MPYDEFKVYLNTKKEVEVVVSVDDLVDKINEMPLPMRWNYAAKILNNLNYEDRLPIDPQRFSDEQIDMIQRYLNKQQSLLEKFKTENNESRSNS